MINDYFKILTEYFTEYNISMGAIDIVETVNVDEAYHRIRPDQVGKSQADSDNYNGFVVSPKDKDGRFTILLNANRMLTSKCNEDYIWVGTIVHEATHVYDHIEYAKILNIDNHDELYDRTKHHMFICWTEFHARSLGHYYVYKYRKINNCECAEERYIADVEIDQTVKWFNEKDAVTDSGYMRIYILMQFLGILNGLEMHYPNVVTEQLVCDMFCEFPEVKELYVFLKNNNSIEKIHTKFEEMHFLCEKCFPGMP